MRAYSVRRIWEDGTIEWASYKRRDGKIKWTRDTEHVMLWSSKKGPIEFRTRLKRDQEKNRSKDNCVVETVSYSLDEIEVLP